jgi:hypothetical protein
LRIRIGRCFHENVVRAIHIGIDQSTITGSEQTARNPLASVHIVMLDWLIIQEADLGGVGLLAHDHGDTGQIRLIGVE